LDDQVLRLDTRSYMNEGILMGEKRKCIRCGRKMKQQFIGLKHCKCGMNWQKGIGYFERSNIH